MLAATLGWAFADAADLAIIVDDIGYDLDRGERVLALPGPVSVAVLPYAPNSVNLARRARSLGKEVLLHQPLESEQSDRPATGTLTLSMSSPDVRRRFEAALASMPEAIGVNNHTGSRFTRSTAAMGLLMQVVRERGLFFIDSRTTPHTVAVDVATTWGVPVARRDVFLDHEVDIAAIETAFSRSIDIALRRGRAIAIAHPHELTIRYLESRLAELDEVNLVPISALVRPARRAAAGLPENLTLLRISPSR